MKQLQNLMQSRKTCLGLFYREATRYKQRYLSEGDWIAPAVTKATGTAVFLMEMLQFDRIPVLQQIADKPFSNLL
ncbi:MAG: hypothetical protein WB502_00555 [Thermoactinomyces sp.]